MQASGCGLLRDAPARGGGELWVIHSDYSREALTWERLVVDVQTASMVASRRVKRSGCAPRRHLSSGQAAGTGRAKKRSWPVFRGAPSRGRAIDRGLVRSSLCIGSRRLLEGDEAQVTLPAKRFLRNPR